MKCDASNNVKNVVNSLKIIHHQHVQNVRRFIRPPGARQSASQLYLCFSPVLLSSAHMYALPAYSVAAKRDFLLPLQEKVRPKLTVDGSVGVSADGSCTYVWQGCRGSNLTFNCVCVT
jgi:hypothetical protein